MIPPSTRARFQALAPRILPSDLENALLLFYAAEICQSLAVRDAAGEFDIRTTFYKYNMKG